MAGIEASMTLGAADGGGTYLSPDDRGTVGLRRSGSVIVAATAEL
jgi:hypothetical protein